MTQKVPLEDVGEFTLDYRGMNNQNILVLTCIQDGFTYIMYMYKYVGYYTRPKSQYLVSLGY